jgi:Abnormal spindle-like microcephaly-assoc'd, ASPM-SPD-2-Hydin/Beta-propeller repeat
MKQGVCGVFSFRNSSREFMWIVIGLVLLGFAVVSIATPANAQTQVFQRWVARIDWGHGPDTASAITSDSQGNLLVIGSVCVAPNTSDPTSCQTNTLQLEKYDANGNRLWGGSLDDVVSAFGEAVATDAADNVYVSGAGDYQTNPGFNDSVRFITIKYSASGERQWIRYYDAGEDQFGGAKFIAVDAQGNSYVTGSTGNANFGPDVTIKYDTNGNQLWVAQFTDSAGNYPSGLALDADGNVYVTGESDSGGIFFSDAYTVKYNSSGQEQWRDVFDGLSQIPAQPGSGGGRSLFGNAGIALDASGNAYVVGQGETDSGSGAQPPFTEYVIKYSPSGSRVWVAAHQSPGGGDGGGDYARAIKLDSAGNVLTAAAVYESFPSTAPYIVSEYSTIKFSPSGTLLWESAYQNTPSGDDQPGTNGALSVNAEGDVYVTGQSTSSSGGVQDYATIKYDPNGDPALWVARYDGTGNGNTVPVGLAGSGGEVVVTGTSVGSSGVNGWATVSYVQDAAHLSPTSLTFGSQAVGTTSAAQGIAVINESEEVLDITGISVSGDFLQTNDCPSELQPEGGCVIQISFRPTATGTRTGTLTVSDDWAGSPRTATLTGTGVAP